VALSMRSTPIAILLAPFWCVDIVNSGVSSDLPNAGEARIVHFEGAVPKVQERSVELQYEFDLTKESFEVFVPKDYSGDEPFGLFIFIDSQNEMKLPREWRPIMEQRKVICVIPQQVGNNRAAKRRMGLAMIGILKAPEMYRIDPKRIFVSGFSGGARCALHLAFLHAGLISGSISICGADFYEPVARVRATNTQGYGVWPVGRDVAARAKAAVRFVFITGDRDPRRGNILDVYDGGFAKGNFHADLIDVPEMGHQLCTPETLSKAFDYLERKD